MTEITYKYDLSQVITQTQYQIKKSQLSPKNINQLAIKIKYTEDDEDKEKLMLQLLTILYINCSVRKKIKRALDKAYTAYTSEEEFLSLFYLIVQESIKRYNISSGDFQNYVSKIIDCTFKNENKSGFLKVTGSVPVEKRTKYYSDNIEDYELGKNSKFENNSEKNIMNSSMIEEISNIKDGNILLYKYLNDTDKPYTNKQLAEHFNLSEKQIRIRLKKVAKNFKKTNPNFFLDYFYDTDNLNETIVVQPAAIIK